MNETFLRKLSNADAIASKETEVRDLLVEANREHCDEIRCDHLGSVIFVKKGCGAHPLKIMFTAHMDEVGFRVRHISDLGFVYLIKTGGVLDNCLDMQKVRITTRSGKKLPGIMNCQRDKAGHPDDIYVDLGFETREQAEKAGLEIGDMVTFDTTCVLPEGTGTIMGKAMDDRTGCYVVSKVLEKLKDRRLENDILMCATSSEEVGTRGAKTAVFQEDPDIVFAIDVANHPELDRSFKNHRQLHKGCMIEHYDKTMAPNDKLLQFAKETARKANISFQEDMLSGGGTDCAQAHLIGNGKPALVIGIPLRYCHGPASIASLSDIDNAVAFVCELAVTLTRKNYEQFLQFTGGMK